MDAAGLRDEYAGALERLAVEITEQRETARPKRYSRAFIAGHLFWRAASVIELAHDAGFLDHDPLIVRILKARKCKGLQVFVLKLETRSTRVDWQDEGWELDADFYRRMASTIRGGADVPAAHLTDEGVAAHSPDFRSVRWNENRYSFTAGQAKCVEMLWHAWAAGTPEVGGSTLLEAVDHVAPPSEMRTLFREHPAWNKLITQGATKGSYQLALPENLRPRGKDTT